MADALASLPAPDPATMTIEAYRAFVGAFPPLPGDPTQMLEAGEQALRAGDREGALQSFKAAYQHRDQLDVGRAHLDPHVCTNRLAHDRHHCR